METAENRFAHLLQPIRELTKNWDIDVASELNDYLEELDDMCITFDDGEIRMNFAEAALLIQGSTCIYSKKVELLHNLVYQTLEYINDKNKKQSKQAAAQQDAADAAESEHQSDDKELFSPQDITRDTSETSWKSGSKPRVCVDPLPPSGLVAPESCEKNKFPLISVKGDVLCSLKDFKFNLFAPEYDVILLLLQPAADPSFLMEDQYAADSLLHGDVTAAAADDDGGAAEDFCPLQDEPMEPEEHVDRHQAPSEGRALRDRRQVDAHEPAKTDESPPAASAWALHNPYGVLGDERPFRPGKCYRVPDGVDDGGKRKRRRAALQDFRSWFRGTFDPPEVKLKNGPKATELNYIYLSTMKEKLRSRRRTCRRAGVAVSDEQLRRNFLQPEGAGPQQEGEEPEDGFCPLPGGDDDSDSEREAAFPDDIPLEFVGGANVMSPDARREDELSYEDLVKLRLEQVYGMCRAYVQETALSRRVKEWQGFLLPELEAQERRPVFNIHEYGDRIVGALSAVGQRRSFASIVSGMDNYEACKYLLASLQLANDGTVEVDSAVAGGGAALEDSVDSMGLTLLSTLRATDRFKDLTPAEAASVSV